MKITICSSLDFTNEIKDLTDQLTGQGHSMLIPETSRMIINGELTLEQIKKEKETGAIAERAVRQNSIRHHFEKIKESDAILVLNLEKKGVRGYIGGNTFLEMGFAHVLGKKIFLWNAIPEMHYKDEIAAMQPVVLNNDFGKIV